MFTVRIPLSEKFWTKVDRREPNDCWPWIGSKTERGYGTMNIGYKANKTQRKIGAHRLAWVLTNGPVPDGTYICHRCDNPPCCNPAHLFVGSQKDNMRDASAKNRIVAGGRFRQPTHCTNGHPLSGSNLRFQQRKGYQERVCRACAIERARQWRLHRTP